MRTLYFCPVVSSIFFYLLFSFLAYSQPSQIGCLPYFHTWCGPSANLECTSENVLRVTRWKYRTQKLAKSRHLGTIAQFCLAISSQLRHVSTIRKQKLLNSNVFPTWLHNMVNFGLLAAEICWRFCGTPANFNRFRVLEAILHGTLVVGVRQTLRSWTDGATYIRQGGHHVGHWSTFLVFYRFHRFCSFLQQFIWNGNYGNLKYHCLSTRSVHRVGRQVTFHQQ